MSNKLDVQNEWEENTHTHSKKLKGRAESYFILFLKINDHPTRCFNFGLRGIYPNDWKFDLNLRKNKHF